MNTMEIAQKILLVEDDPILARNIKLGLTDQGYQVKAAASLEAAQRISREHEIDLLLLDLGLPDGSGFDFLQQFRTSRSGTPVMILTARDEVTDKIKGLDLGADDYLVKPFDFQELSARIRAHLRRSAGQHSSTLGVADLEVDLVKRIVKRDGEAIECTPREFDVLVYLATTPGQVISRQMLMTEVWKVRSRMTSMDNVIDVLMSRLREKIDGGRAVRLIHTVRGLGFMIKEPES